MKSSLCFIILATACLQAQEIGWSGSAQCLLTVQSPSYFHQETQTWTIGGLPSMQGALTTYAGTWSVTGQGWRQEVQGPQVAKMQWSVNVPPQPALFHVFVRASDNQILILSAHSQLRLNSAGTMTRQTAYAAVAQRPTQQTVVEYEWQFPGIHDVSTSTNLTGASTTPDIRGVGPMETAAVRGSAECKWNFSKSKSPAISPRTIVRLSNFSATLPPTVKSWVAQQAQSLAKSSNVDPSQLENQAYADVASGKTSYPQLFAGMDVMELAFFILMSAEVDQQNDLQQLMQQVQSDNQTKQQLNQVAGQINQELSSTNPRLKDQVCITPNCQSLPARLNQLASLTPQVAQASQTAAGGNITYQQLQQMLVQLKSVNDNLSDMSGQDQVKLQLAQDRQSKFLQALSNMEKKMSDTSQAIDNNIK